MPGQAKGLLSPFLRWVIVRKVYPFLGRLGRKSQFENR